MNKGTFNVLRQIVSLICLKRVYRKPTTIRSTSCFQNTAVSPVPRKLIVQLGLDVLLVRHVLFGYKNQIPLAIKTYKGVPRGSQQVG